MALVLEWGKFWKGVFVLIRPLKRIYSITTKLTLIGRKCKGVKPLKEEWIWDKPCTWVSFALREPQHLHVYTCSVPLAVLPQQNMEPRHHCLFQLPGNVGCLGIGTGPNASRFPRLHKTTFRASSLGHLAWPKKRLVRVELWKYCHLLINRRSTRRSSFSWWQSSHCGLHILLKGKHPPPSP